MEAVDRLAVMKKHRIECAFQEFMKSRGVLQSQMTVDNMREAFIAGLGYGNKLVPPSTPRYDDVFFDGCEALFGVDK